MRSSQNLWDGSVDDLLALDELRRAVEAQHPAKPAPPQQRSSLEEYRGVIEPRALKGPGPQSIHDRLRQEHSEFRGSVSAVKRICRSIRRERGVRAQDVAIPMETNPGQEAQVDFGHVGYLYDPTEGRLRKAHVFVMVLSYSRHQFARICFDQKVETWLQLHIEAFEHFAGVPAFIVPDNLKSAVVRAAFSPSDPTTLIEVAANRRDTTASRSHPLPRGAHGKSDYQGARDAEFGRVPCPILTFQ